MTFNLFNGERPPPGEGGPVAQISPQTVRRYVRIGLIILALILLFVLLNQARGVYTDWLWFGSIDYRPVFSKILVLRIWLFFAGAAFFLSFLLANLYFAHRFSRGSSVLPVPPDLLSLIRIGSVAGVVLTAVIMAIVFGAVASNRWETFLLFFNKVSFGVTDAHYGKDISFYVSVLPLLHFIQGWLMGMVIATAVAMAAFYFLMAAARGIQFSLTPPMRGHLAVLGALLMVTIAAAHYLDTFEPLFSGGGAAFGLSYTDDNARILALRILTGIALLAGVGFLVSLYFGGLRFMIASFGLWVVLAIVVGAVYPALVQRLRVNPDEFNKEQPYIQRNLDATRAAYGLDLIEVEPFKYSQILSAQDVAENLQTKENIRLWDPDLLAANYNQIQFFELYYDFVGVDVDRYRVNGDYRQVMLGARELTPEDLPEEAQRWVNRRLQYTHGYGAAVSPVREFTTEGGPEFFLKDIPPTGDLDLSARPEIYYGENTNEFVIVKTHTVEFDYPGEEGAVYTSDAYQGSGGVGVGSFIRKLAFAWEFLDFNILISNQLTSDSRVMYRRNIAERVAEVAPFLRLDADPYLVVADSRLWWIQDAYTTTERYPYSTPSADGFNYIRNSVKVVVDAFNGTLQFYIVDPGDPMVQIYQRAFPDLFEPVAEPDPFKALPESLQDHVRYPLDLFTIQARRYLQYHMTDPQVFYNKEDQWDFGNEVFFGEPQLVRPYYTIMKLPGETEEEFVLIMPFTPFEKINMVAWMAARNDGEHYGQLQTFLFPTGTTVFGPEQIEGRITSDEAIGREFTLLCPEGKLCIRGNLLVIPMGSSILYVEPLFIRPQALDFPLLKKVIVADGTSVVMADTLDEGLTQLVALGGKPGEPEAPAGEAPAPTAPTPRPGAPPTAPEDLRQLIDAIQELLEQLERELESLGQEPGGSVQ